MSRGFFPLIRGALDARTDIDFDSNIYSGASYTTFIAHSAARSCNRAIMPFNGVGFAS